MADPRARVVITAEDRASKALKRIKGEATGLSKAFNALRIALPVGAFVAATKGALNYADRIADMAEQTAFSAGKLQELKFAAEQNGVAFNELGAGLGRFTKRLGLARRGTGAAAQTYKELGINLSQTNDQVFNQVVETLGRMENETDRLALTTRLFGDDAQRLGVVFKDGVSGLDAYAKRARELGLVLSDDLVQGASDANDQLDVMQKIIQTQLISAFVELGPYIVQAGNWFLEQIPKIRKFADEVTQFAATVGAPFREGLENETILQIDERIAFLAEDIVKLRNASKEGAIDPGYFEDLARLEAEYSFLQNRRARLIADIEATEKFGPFDDAGMISRLNKPKPSLLGVDKKKSSGLSAAQKEYNRLMEEGKRLTESLFTPQEAYNTQLEKLEKLQAAGAINQQTKNRALIEYQAVLDEATGKTAQFNALQDVIADVDPVAPLLDQLDALRELEIAFPQYADIIGEAMFDVQDQIDKVNGGLENQVDKVKDVEDAWQELGPVFASAFEDAIVEGGNLRDLLKGLEQDIIRIITRKAITEPLGNAISGAFSGSSGFLSGIFGSLFGGAKAGGGPVMPGRAYLVGEEGPELVVPRSASTVIPNGAGNTFNFTFALPSDGVNYRRTAQQVAREASRMIASAQGAV